MSRQDHQQNVRWRRWIIQAALLCFLALHTVGLLHHHVTASEQDGCFACQVADHHPLDVPDVGLCAGFVLVLLYLTRARLYSLSYSSKLLYRPRSRAPPSSLLFA